MNNDENKDLILNVTEKLTKAEGFMEGVCTMAELRDNREVLDNLENVIKKETRP